MHQTVHIIPINPKKQKGSETMTKYLIKRVLLMIVTLFMIALLTFCLMHIVPGSPFTSQKQVSQAVMDALMAKYNLDDPLWKQFVDYMVGVLHFDFGPSYKYTGKTVNDFIEGGMPYSGTLGLVTLVFVLLMSIPMGIVAALPFHLSSLSLVVVV